MLLIFLLFQRNIYLVLACERGPKNSIHRDLFKTKCPKITGAFAPWSSPELCPGSAGGVSQHPQTRSSILHNKPILKSQYFNTHITLMEIEIDTKLIKMICSLSPLPSDM